MAGDGKVEMAAVAVMCEEEVVEGSEIVVLHLHCLEAWKVAEAEAVEEGIVEACYWQNFVIEVVEAVETGFGLDEAAEEAAEAVAFAAVAIVMSLDVDAVEEVLVLETECYFEKAVEEHDQMEAFLAVNIAVVVTVAAVAFVVD